MHPAYLHHHTTNTGATKLIRQIARGHSPSHHHHKNQQLELKHGTSKPYIQNGFYIGRVVAKYAITKLADSAPYIQGATIRIQTECVHILRINTNRGLR